MKDERIKQVHDQIMGEFGTTVFFFALAAFLVKILLLHKGLSDCVVEYVIIIGAPLFQAVRCRQMKIAFYRPGMEKTYWKKALAVLAVVALVYIAYGQVSRPLRQSGLGPFFWRRSGRESWKRSLRTSKT